NNVLAVYSLVVYQVSIDELCLFDLITSRAFESLTDFVVAARPYLHEQSIIAALKGLIPGEEMEELKQEGSFKVSVLDVARLDEQRHLL
ncbi:RsmG family class I SAM-dependent methyltransferase, partial [Acinetobacter baumannii]|uniref:RsmG family class I SAM-dependent methyltransferase n=1 Tax=Acinetobacter baumannii TaxID=470 RepID=UPI003AF517EC